MKKKMLVEPAMRIGLIHAATYGRSRERHKIMSKKTRVALIALGVLSALAAVYYTLVLLLIQGIR